MEPQSPPGYPPLQTGSLLLRFLEPGDAPRVFAMSQEPGIRTWLPDQVYRDEAHALDVLRALIQAYDAPGTPRLGPFVLGVALRDSRELIGHVGLSPLGDQVEVGYAIAEGHQRRGYATGAVAAMVGWGLARFGLPGVLGVVSRDNHASCEVLRRAGFELLRETEGTLHGRRGVICVYEKPAGQTSATRGDWG